MRVSIFSFFLTLSLASSNAQIKVDFNVGLQMGNTSYAQNYPYFTTFKSGYFVGAGLVKDLNKVWALKTDIQFSQKGHKVTGAKKIGPTPIETIPATRRYIEIMPHLERKIYERLVAFAGPGYGLKLSEQFNDVSMQNLVNRNDIFFHGGIHYYLDKTYLILSLKRSFTESDGIYLSDEEGNRIQDLRSRNINVLFGMGFRM